MDNHTWERGEEKIQNGLPTMARDAETGECWLQQQPSVTEELGDKPSGFPIFAKCTKHYTTIKAWKIPKEYSNLGSSSKSLSTSNLSLTRNAFRGTKLFKFQYKLNEIVFFWKFN